MKSVEIDGRPYNLRPLTGRFLPKLFAVLQSFNFKQGEEIDTSEVMKSFDEATVQKLHELLLETFKKSYPKEDAEKLDEFVTQNFLQLFPALIEVNLNTKKAE